MSSRNLLIAAIILAALSGVVWWSKRHPETPATSTPAAAPKLADITAGQIKQIDLTKKDGATLTIARQNGKWAITSPQALPADQDAVNSVAAALNPLTSDNVVESQPTDVAKYGLTSPSLTVTVHENNGKSDRIYFGDDVPAGSLVYARVGSDPKVYAVASSTKTSLDKSATDLRDKRLLTFDSNRLTRIELASAKSDIEFGKNNQNEWQIVKPQPYRADSFEVEELLRKLTEAKMDVSGTPQDTKKVDAAFAAGQPVATAKVTDAAGTQSLEVRKNKDDYYAKGTAVQGVYKLSSDLGKELEKPLDDFRNKKIFDFGFSDLSRFEIQQGSGDKAYVRTGTDWKLNGTTMDSGAVQALIDKLRDLAATKFATSGFTAPALTISVTWNDGKRTDRAEFAKANDGYIARRASEPALYQLDNKAVNDILEASNAIKPAASASKK